MGWISPPPPNILSLKYSLLWELETSKQKFKTINILNFVHAWEKKHFSSAFTSSFQLVTYVRLSTCCYMLQHYVPCKQYVIIKISAVFHCLSVGYFRSSKRWNIYYKTVFFCVHFIYFSFRSSHKRFSVKKGVLKSFENSAILQLLEACNFIKKRLWHRCFPVNFAIFLRTRFLQKTSRRLLLASIQARVFQHRSKQHKS